MRPLFLSLLFLFVLGCHESTPAASDDAADPVDLAGESTPTVAKDATPTAAD